jgi:hypothetical protein
MLEGFAASDRFVVELRKQEFRNFHGISSRSKLDALAGNEGLLERFET